ncbi:MAG: L,D-transpeptidase family protein [Candidatus Omnitrophota bacterium]
MRRNILIGIGVAAILFIITVLFFLKKEKEEIVVPVESSQSGLLKKAQDKLSAKDFLAARALYKEALENTDDLSLIEKVKEKIEKLNMEILFSGVIDECSVEYAVQPNDALSKIAKQFETTVELIKRANSLDSDVIMPNQKLKVSKCKFSLAIDKSQNKLFLKRNGEVIKTYIVSTGKDNSTPVGRFQIINKLKEPTWFKAGAVVLPGSPENILGSRWMGLDAKGYGIHGNRNANEIGKQVTQGCVRMKNKEVEEVYDILPTGTEVVIVD